MNIRAAETTVREVVVEDYRAAAVFQKYGLDFCCGGGATIEKACRKKGVEMDTLLADLHNLQATSSAGEPRVNEWELDFLAEYIVQHHHRYVRSVLPSVLEHAEKVARVHGGARPSLVEIAKIFSGIASELEHHMMKEEHVLFPRIKELVRRDRQGNTSAAPSPVDVQGAIRAMEDEHQKAGDDMKVIRELSDNFVPPPDACMTYRVLFKELEEFENDLHRHVHLENNVLFPKAVALEVAGSSSMQMCSV